MKVSEVTPKKRTKKFLAIDKDHLRKLVVSGFTDEQIADFFCIGRETLARWKRWYPEFKEKMSEWKLIADNVVEKSLYKRACGYDVVEKTSELIDGKMVVTKEVTKHIPASVTGIIFWTTNRMHGDWRRTREEVGADPLSVKVYQIIKNGNGKGGKNGKANKNDSVLVEDAEIQSAIQIERKGVKVV